MRFVVNQKRDEIAEDLAKKALIEPALEPYILAQISGRANQVAVPVILSGEPGLGVDSGKTRDKGLRAIFKAKKTGFESNLWTPLLNIFIPGTKRGIKPRHIWETFDPAFRASGISEEVMKKALDDFDKNKIEDLSKYLTLGMRRRRK